MTRHVCYFVRMKLLRSLKERANPASYNDSRKCDLFCKHLPPRMCIFSA